MYTSSPSLYLLVIIIIKQISYITTEKLPSALSSIELATKYGHPPTQYNIITEDGYILAVFRLPGRSRIPVLLMHGILDSSDMWMLRGNTSLAITLANNGYDVWLANSRGNRYSRRHKILNPDTDPAFWQFSFHEMGYYDLPAVIDTILNESGAKKLSAIGHSQGNTMFYVLGSERKEYNSKINVLIALAPIAYLHNTPPPLSIVIQLSPLIESLVKKLGVYEIFGDNSTTGLLVHKFCSTPDIAYAVCIEQILFPVLGFDREELEPEFAPTLTVHYPAGTSVQSILHFLQIGYRKMFARYNYGSKVNRRTYNSPDPPEYQWDKITMPIALLAARNDRLSSIPDVAILRRRLPSVVFYLENPRSTLNHVDFIVGRNMPVYLFPYIFQILHENNHFVD
ncbi:lipase 1-like [Maniola hyperantus]|uniref:lipase 1-like n=1 Tax=Aphantopus hyperantus TaxID=2795564 RepID=UPI003747FF89